MWKKSLRKGNTTQFKKIGSPTSIVADAAGKNLFLIGKELRKMSIPSGNMTNISFSRLSGNRPGQRARVYV